jgi:hypothetical protein
VTGGPATATSHAYRVGEIELVAVSVGVRTAPVAEGFVLNAPLGDVKRAYAAYGLPDGHGSTPFNPTVIRTGAAESTRRRTLESLARRQLPGQGFHFPFPGRALVEAVGDAYRAVPIRAAG